MQNLTQPLVLIVEDDPVIAQLLSILCSQLGYRSIRAGDGQIALDELATVRPQLITLDLNLPQLSGQEVLAHVREHGALAATPVLVVSAMDPDEQVCSLADAAIKKPFDVDQLCAMMQELVASTELQERALGA
jgi:two-component system response regulator AdeR